MKYLFNGVDGHLGSVAANESLNLLNPTDLIFAAPDIKKINKENLKKWTDAGVEIREASYDNYDQMVKAYHGVDRMLLLSTWMIGETRRKQHRDAINAAKEAGVKHIVYTSVKGAEIEVGTPVVASDHRDTEKALMESGLEYTIQRNMLYFDYIFSMFVPISLYKNNCVWPSNTDGVKVAYVFRDDCARVAAALVAGKGESYKVYTVTGPELLSEEELFKIASEYTGKEIEYINMSTEAYYDYWEKRGVPRTVHGDFSNSPLPICTIDLVENGDSIRSGHFCETTNVIEDLTGRKPTSAREGISYYKDVILPR
ncbi:MAG: NAD(P)-dependent oxidoreductase [Paenibacillaceae bacterium]|nr:NAD(P)-dependent oxidoreductase [Paenibacillaceae bacterium]